MENINFETIYIVIEVISLWNDRQKYAQLLLQILFVVGLNLLFARRLSTYALCSIKGQYHEACQDIIALYNIQIAGTFTVLFSYSV